MRSCCREIQIKPHGLIDRKALKIGLIKDGRGTHAESHQYSCPKSRPPQRCALSTKKSGTPFQGRPT